MHIIRLRGPWQVEAVARFVPLPDGSYRPDHDNLPVAARMTMPADWSAVCGADFLGRVRYRRAFNKPTGLESGERVFLVVERPRSWGRGELNGKPLGDVARGESMGRFDVTAILEPHNQLEILVEHPALDGAFPAQDDGDLDAPGGLVGEVWLEIEEWTNHRDTEDTEKSSK